MTDHEAQAKARAEEAARAKAAADRATAMERAKARFLGDGGSEQDWRESVEPQVIARWRLERAYAAFTDTAEADRIRSTGDYRL